MLSKSVESQFSPFFDIESQRKRRTKEGLINSRMVCDGQAMFRPIQVGCEILYARLLLFTSHTERPSAP